MMDGNRYSLGYPVLIDVKSITYKTGKKSREALRAVAVRKTGSISIAKEGDQLLTFFRDTA